MPVFERISFLLQKNLISKSEAHILYLIYLLPLENFTENLFKLRSETSIKAVYEVLEEKINAERQEKMIFAEEV